MPVSFRVTCSCGAAHAGVRQAQHQVLACQRCRRPVFVLPQSPWLADEAVPSRTPSVTVPPRRRWLPWLAAALVLGLAASGVGWLIWHWAISSNAALKNNQDGLVEARAALTQAKVMLSQGQFRRAQQQLEEHEQRGDELPTADRRVWRQTLAQARLLADLSPEPLEDIVRHAASVAPDEWQADFAHRFHNKALVFDAEFRRLPEGRLGASYELFQAGEPVELRFADVGLIKELGWQDSVRLVLGVRLASIRREPPGPRWVVRFHADAAVLLTDPGAAASLSPGFSSAEVQKHLEIQARWATDLLSKVKGKAAKH